MRPVHLCLIFCLALVWEHLAAGQEALPSPNPPMNSHQELGRDLYQRLACHGCHAQPGRGNEREPDLEQVGRRLTRSEIETQLLTPRRRQAGAGMPCFAFVKTHEIQALLDYLHSLPCRPLMPTAGETSFKQGD